MVHLQKYSSDEVSTLHLVPLWVFYAVAGADSVIDQREITSFKGILKEANSLSDEFSRGVLGALHDNFDAAVLQSRNEKPIEGIRRAMEIVSRKSAPTESETFKQVVFVIGWSVAAASGDFSETGEGSNISDEEIQNLSIIADALSLSVTTLRKVITSSDATKIWQTFLQ
jgi:hypothetical protein